MVLQALQVAIVLVIMLQMMLFVVSSPAGSLKAAYADSCRKTGTVITYVFKVQRGPEQWIGAAAFGTIGFYVAIAALLDALSGQRELKDVMTWPDLANTALAGWEALYHFISAYLWPTGRSLMVAVLPFIVMVYALFGRPRASKDKAESARHD